MMLADLARLEGVFGCLKVSKEPKALQVLEEPDEFNGLFGAWRILMEPKVSLDICEILCAQRCFRMSAES